MAVLSPYPPLEVVPPPLSHYVCWWYFCFLQRPLSEICWTFSINMKLHQARLLTKTRVTFTWAVHRKAKIASVLGFNEGSFPFTYIGVPIKIGKPKRAHLQSLADKVLSKLAGWKGKIKCFLWQVKKLNQISNQRKKGVILLHFWSAPSLCYHARTLNPSLAFTHISFENTDITSFKRRSTCFLYLLSTCSPSYSKRQTHHPFLWPYLTYLICKQIESTPSLNLQRPLLTKSSPALNHHPRLSISTKNAHPRGTR